MESCQTIAGNGADVGSPKEVTGFLDFNLYPYTKVASDNAVTVNAQADLEHDLQYASLTNFGRDANRGELEEFDGFLTEQNLRWTVPHSDGLVQATAQALMRSGVGNDALRLGARLAVHGLPGVSSVCDSVGLRYWVDFHAIQFDHAAGTQWQIEHVFRINVLPELFDDRVYVGGFADDNIDYRGSRHTWVAEAQLGVRTFDNYYLVAEARHNGYRSSETSSLGIGVEYVIRF